MKYQKLHRSRQRKACIEKRIPPGTGMYRGHSRGGICKQDKALSAVGRRTSHGNAGRGEKIPKNRGVFTHSPHHRRQDDIGLLSPKKEELRSSDIQNRLFQGILGSLVYDHKKERTR